MSLSLGEIVRKRDVLWLLHLDDTKKTRLLRSKCRSKPYSAHVVERGARFEFFRSLQMARGHPACLSR